jgi:tRNA wybutosine-synthesizing protein 4
VAAVDLILRRFVAVARRTADGGKCQVVSLGAGHDTTFFKLFASGDAPTKYFEVDFPDVTARKAAILRKQPLLQRCVAGEAVPPAELVAAPSDYTPPSPAAAANAPPASAPAASGDSGAAPAAASAAAAAAIKYTPAPGGGVDVSAPLYQLVTADLRDIAALQAALRGAGIDAEAPTLFLSECVLVYLEPEESCAIIAWAAGAFKRSVFVTYEQIRPHDAFGQVMARNLEERGYSLRGLQAFPDLAAQTARYRELGFAACTVADMNDVYYRLLPRPDLARVERLEIFDEVEEWHLMSAHYCLAVAVNEVGAGPRGRSASASGRAAAASSDSAAPASGGAAPLGSGHHHHHHHHHQHGQHATGHKRDAHEAASASSSGGVVVTDMPAPAPKVARTSHAQVSPRELAEQVVHAHEEQAAAHAVQRTRSLRSLAGSPSAAAADASGDVEMAGSAAGSSAAAAGSARGLQIHSPAPGASSGGSASDTAPSPIIHTAHSEVVLGARVDVAAISEAEDEMDHARHTREAVGIDVMRDLAAAAATSGGGKGVSGAPGVATAGGAGTHLFAPAVEGSRHQIEASAAAPSHYDAASIAAAAAGHVSLTDMLFPLQQWASAASPAKHRGGFIM